MIISQIKRGKCPSPTQAQGPGQGTHPFRADACFGKAELVEVGEGVGACGGGGGGVCVGGGGGGGRGGDHPCSEAGKADVTDGIVS